MRVRTLGLIPARAGSKGIRGKNTRPFRGRPLWVHAAEIAAQTCEEWIVSTDDPIILRDWEETRYAGHHLHGRPESLAEDDTPMIEVVKDALCSFSADLVVLLQPTQPLRTTDHVEDALTFLGQHSSAISVARIPAHLSPDYACRIDPGNALQIPRGVTRRQDCRPSWYRDGTVYVFRSDLVKQGDLYGEDPYPIAIPANETVTLDTEEDWEYAEWRAERVMV